MDIDKVTGCIHPTQAAGQGKAKTDNTFAQILDRAADAVQRGAAPHEAGCCSPPVVGGASCKVSHVDSPTLKHASKVLDVLEEYAKALENPQITLKSIEPIVLRIQQELKGLDVGSMTHPGQRDELADLVNHIAVTASVEAFKFQRGDYVA
ncbi:MAG: hypothetical protein PVH78_01095 [Deltaproteobacteria bacterium]|jgi:hypothetical protein